jgi:hypothetical protein
MFARKQRKQRKEFKKIYLNSGVLKDAYLFNQTEKISKKSYLKNLQNQLFKITYQGFINLLVFTPYLSKNMLHVLVEKITEQFSELNYSWKSRNKSNPV